MNGAPAQRFGAPPDDEAILAADAMTLIADGSKTVGDDRQKLAEELAGRTEVIGITGTLERKDGRLVRPMWVERSAKGMRLAIERVPE